jgi:hypothetical protein
LVSSLKTCDNKTIDGFDYPWDVFVLIRKVLARIVDVDEHRGVGLEKQ